MLLPYDAALQRRPSALRSLLPSCPPVCDPKPPTVKAMVCMPIKIAYGFGPTWESYIFIEKSRTGTLNSLRPYVLAPSPASILQHESLACIQTARLAHFPRKIASAPTDRLAEAWPKVPNDKAASTMRPLVGPAVPWSKPGTCERKFGLETKSDYW